MIIKMKTNALEKVDEKMLLLLIIGSLEDIKNRAVTIDEVINELKQEAIMLAKNCEEYNVKNKEL